MDDCRSCSDIVTRKFASTKATNVTVGTLDVLVVKDMLRCCRQPAPTLELPSDVIPVAIVTAACVSLLSMTVHLIVGHCRSSCPS